MQNTSSVCPRCQSAIPADAPGGICPACALRGVVEGTDSAPFAAASVPTAEEISAAFPEYEVLGPIGQGGMSVVFKARQPRLDRMVALKILPPSLAAQPGFAERFTREARALARLAHPHIVAVYDFGERAGFYYLVMEFVDGVNLRQALRAGITPEQALQLVPRICEALQFAHDRGVLHRDIKPENILLDLAGTPKLADFGIAKLAGDQGAATGLTGTGAALGTAVYMAPEQIEKPATVDHRADIYSLGVVLYEMLTGELPLGRFAPPSEKSDVSRGVDEVVLRALEKERSRRQQSATEMKTEVEGASAAPSEPPGMRLGIHKETGLPWKRIFTALTALSGVGIAVVPMLHWNILKPEHMVALTMVFGTLTALSKTSTSEIRPARLKQKDLGMAYVFWFLFGLLGGHKFYLGQIGWGLLYLFTGGLFFIGWIIDLFTLPSQVRNVNQDLMRRGVPAGAGPAAPSEPPNPWPLRVALLLIIGIIALAAGIGHLAVKNGFLKEASFQFQPGHFNFSFHGGKPDPEPNHAGSAPAGSAPEPAGVEAQNGNVKAAQDRLTTAGQNLAMVRATVEKGGAPQSALEAAEKELGDAREQLERAQSGAAPKPE